MKYFYAKVVILISFAFCISALVHYQKMEKGGNQQIFELCEMHLCVNVFSERV